MPAFSRSGTNGMSGKRFTDFAGVRAAGIDNREGQDVDRIAITTESATR